jgi:hypothetical protein
MPADAMPAQMPIALPRSSRGNRFVMIDRVAGMINAPPIPISARTRISWLAVSTSSTPRLAPPNSSRPAWSAKSPAEAVAERAHRQQQPGEDQEVRVDDPLQGRAGGTELLLQARQRDVEDGVVEPDDQQAQREHRERLPATRVVDRIDGHGRLLLEHVGGWSHRGRAGPRIV